MDQKKANDNSHDADEKSMDIGIKKVDLTQVKGYENTAVNKSNDNKVSDKQQAQKVNKDAVNKSEPVV